MYSGGGANENMKEKQNLYVSSVANVKYMTNSDVPYS
jgi:hypothetical protein